MWEFWRGKLAKGRASPRSSSGLGSPRAGGDAASASSSARRPPAVVNFKDLNLSVDDELSEEEAGHPANDEDPTNKASIRTGSVRSGAQKNKLIIIMVGLPGRGKTFLCNKLKCYLNWLGHNTAHFNVGNYRRSQKEAHEVQDATFFDSHNKHGVEARSRALMAAIDDVVRFLSEGGQVAIFDATNTTKERRQLLIDTFHGRCQYIFIESICNDTQVLEANYRYKMKYSPDYQGVDTEAALDDFKARINKYNEVYEAIDDRRLHYIKLIDMVTGRGYMDVNRISGYIPGKIVFFLMQVCKAGMTAGQSRKIWLTRHGESMFNMAGRIGGDSGLTPRGDEYARKLPDALEGRLPATFNEAGVPVSVWTSTLRRTILTAAHLPYPKLRWKALDEIHAGVCDGLTYSEIAAKLPEDYEARKRDKLRYRYPSGESYLDVIQRLEPVIIEMEREREYVCVVGHQAVLRAIFGYFMAVPLDRIPRLDIPLHTLIELQPRADGTMEVAFMPVPISGAPSPPLKQPSLSLQMPLQHQYAQQQQQQQQQQGQLVQAARSPQLLATFGSLPSAGMASRNGSASSGGAQAGNGEGGSSAGGGATPGRHRRSASLPYAPGVMRPVTSFATVSSMASLVSSTSHDDLAAHGGAAAAAGVAAGGDVEPLALGPQPSLSAWTHQRSPSGSSCGMPVISPAAAGMGSGAVDPAVAAELQLSGLALDESVALTSGADPADLAAAAAAAAAAGSGSEEDDCMGPLPLRPSGGSSSTLGSPGSQQRSPVLAAAIGSMASLD